MTKKLNTFKTYAKSAAISLLTLASCSQHENDSAPSGPIKQKTEQAIKVLNAQNTTTNNLDKEIQSAKQIQTRATMDDRIIQQQNIIDGARLDYERDFLNVTSGSAAIITFDQAAQEYANTTPLDMNDFRQRVTIHRDFADRIEANQITSIPFASLTPVQAQNLSRLKVSAATLEHALEIMERLTGGVDRAQQQINDFQTWIHDLSIQIVNVLESATGNKIQTRTDKGQPLPTQEILNQANELIAKTSEQDLAPHAAEIDTVTQKIEQVQEGLDRIVQFWQDLANETTRGKIAAQGKQKMHVQKFTAQSDSQKFVLLQNRYVRSRG